MKKIKLICADLDGLCINMSEPAAYAHNIELPKGIIPDNYLYEKIGNKKAFWSKCSGHDFWANLEPYEWTADLLKMIDNSGINWCFLSKASLDAGSYSGKYACIKKWFPRYLDKLWLVRGTKSYMAGNGRLLIDDKMNPNGKDWTDNGGEFYHWEELHPSQIKEANFRIEEIRNILDKHR